MLKSIPIGESYACLEIGCGNGTFISNISSHGLKVTGIDIVEKSVAIAKKKNPSVTILRKSLFDVEDTYNIVFCFEVLEHLKNDNDAIEKISQIIKEGGYFMCSVPAHPNLYYDVVDKYYGHFRRYEKKEFINLLKANNLKIIFFWNYGLKVASIFANLIFSYRSKKNIEFAAIGDDFSEVKYPWYWQKIIAPIVSKFYLLFYLLDLLFLKYDLGNSYLVLCKKE
jgi:SAM-dependent methyltransferase